MSQFVQRHKKAVDLTHTLSEWVVWMQVSAHVSCISPADFFPNTVDSKQQLCGNDLETLLHYKKVVISSLMVSQLCQILLNSSIHKRSNIKGKKKHFLYTPELICCDRNICRKSNYQRRKSRKEMDKWFSLNPLWKQPHCCLWRILVFCFGHSFPLSWTKT